MGRACLAALVLLCGGFGQAAAQPPKQDRVEEGVARALTFLQRMQEADGSWSANGSRHAGVTGLAVLAFLSAGHVPGEGPYGATVDKGVRWVLKNQQANGLIANEGGHEMYHHGICTLMLAEAAGMTDGKLAVQMKGALEKAVRLILQAQRTTGGYRGGWRYQVQGFDADMSVTGWQLLALRAAKNLGCDVPADRIDMAVDYVKRSRDPNTGGFCYMPGGGVTIPCTGTAILCLEVCGKDQHRSREALQAGALLLKQPPQWHEHHFCYAIYYGSQATFQLGNNYWNYFRPQMHKLLFDQQRDNGCWLEGNNSFGPSYATAMCVLALTVEYRFLPIYQRGEEP